MKKIIQLTVIVLSTGFYSNVYAQQTPAPPSVSGDKNMQDTNIRTRSMDLERVDRDAKKTGTTANDQAKKNAATAEDKLAAKFEEIKTDYEQIQVSQDAVIKTYQTSGTINYAQIGKSALEINKSAARLNSNLFPVAEIPDAEKEEKKESKSEKETKPAKSVRDLIVDLDNAIGSFATSPMFQNLRVVEPTASAKAKADLQKIIELSAFLAEGAGKMAASGNLK